MMVGHILNASILDYKNDKYIVTLLRQETIAKYGEYIFE